MPAPQPHLSADEVRKVARLARLDLTDAQVEQYRAQLSAVLGYVDRLRTLDLTGVEPMSHPGADLQGQPNRLDDDTRHAPLPTEALMAMAPARADPFVEIPKVLGEGGGA